MSYLFTIAIPEDMELRQEGNMLKLGFNKPYTLFELTDQLKGLEDALLIGLGYGGEITE